MKKSLMRLFVALPLLFTTSLATAADDTPKPYPLNTCVVSGEKLGEMGDPYVFIKDGQEVKLCCKSCLKKFEKAPEQYLAKLKKPDPAEKD